MNLPVNTLGRDFIDIQSLHSLPNTLATEVEEYITKIGITDLQNVSKWKFKKFTKDYVSKLNKESLLEDSKIYKKINYDDLVKEKYEMKEYFRTQNLHQARFLFRLSSLMVDGIRTHHSSKYRRRGIPLSCPSCSIPITTENDNLVMVPIDAPRDDVKHIMTECVKYEEMKENRDIFNSESDLISFFQDVLKYREENNQM